MTKKYILLAVVRATVTKGSVIDGFDTCSIIVVATNHTPLRRKEKNSSVRQNF